jgi:hypothetical protein
MGIVSASLPGPVTTVGIPFQGRTVTNDEALKMTGKEPDQLIEETSSRAANVDVGRIRIRDGCMGDRWKIGPLIFDWDGEHHLKERWLAKGAGSAYVTTDGHRSTAKWNGSTLLSEAAKKQVKDVMEETPIDLVEMLTTTEEVLAKYD